MPNQQSDWAIEGATALVTGSGRGIGKGIALALARAGCSVAVNEKSDLALAERTVDEIRALGVEAWAVAADIGSASEVDAMFEQVQRRFSRLAILVNNAAVQTWGALLDLSEADWDRDIRTNLKGCFLCTQRAARLMKNGGGGSIVNIGSGCNKLAFPRLVAYTASKGGIETFTKVAAVELAPYGIRVNCVAPGATEVERTRAEDPEYAKTWSGVTPLGRIGTPADVAGAVVFLSSEAAAFVTGQTLWVDGGLFTQPVWPYERK